MKLFKRFPTWLFIAFIGIMLILFLILPKNEYSPSEKRYLQKAPAFTVSDYFSGKFNKDFETYLCDHFPLRKLYVGINSYYDYLSGNNGKNGYYLCKNGYIVNDPTTTEKLDTNIDIVTEFANNNKIDTTILLAPSTGYICNDVLPKNHLQYKDDEIFERCIDAFNDTNIKFVDIRNDFKKEYQKANQLYYKTDHHWTSYGAFTAYNTLSNTLNYIPSNKNDFSISSINDFYGTTYSSSGYWLTKPDTLEVWDSKNNADVYIKDGNQKITNSSCFFYENLKGDDQYTVFLDGNHPYTTITNENAEKDENLLIIKDSFAHSLTPFLSNNYKNITMIDMRYYKESVGDLIKENNIDKLLFVYSLDNFCTDTDLAWLE